MGTAARRNTGERPVTITEAEKTRVVLQGWETGHAFEQERIERALTHPYDDPVNPILRPPDNPYPDGDPRHYMWRFGCRQALAGRTPRPKKGPAT